MKLFVRVAVPALVGLLAFGASENHAHALGPIDVELGAKVGVATNPNSDGPSPFGFGIGGRGGVSVFGLYGGLSAVHYFGGSKDIGNVTVDASSTLLGVEVGYTIKAVPVLRIRPQIGVGNAHFSSGADGTDVTSSNDHVYLEPGLSVIIPLALLYVGADANAILVPGVDSPTLSDPGATKTYAAFSIHAQVGVTF